MKNKMILAVLPVLLLASCKNGGGAEPEVFPDLSYTVTYEEKEEGHGTITDMIGRKVDIAPGAYSRVVCVGAGALRLFSYLGKLNLLCGVEDIDNLTLSERPKMFDRTARPYVMAGEGFYSALPSCGVGGPNAQTIEAEKIAACKPDIVISEYEDVEKEDALQEKLGVPVITLNYGKGGMVNSGLYGTLAMLGKVFGEEARARSLIEYHYDMTKKVFDRTKEVKSKRKAYICGLGNWGTTDQFMTAQNFDTFNVAHIDGVVKGKATDGVVKITEEEFVSLAKDMEVMVFDAAAVKNIKGKGYDFSLCKAFQTGEVYLQMAYNAYYTNVETALVNTWFVAKSVYPNLFEDVDIAKLADEVTFRFNGIKLYERMKELPFSYGGYQKVNNPTEFFA